MTDIVNPNQTYSYEKMKKDISLMQKRYKDFIQTEVIGKSVENRNLYAIKLGYGDTEIFLNGAHHAREWLTTTLLMNMIDYYCESRDLNEKIGDYNPKEIFSKVSLWFVPMVNPDGVSLVQEGHLSAANSDELVELNGGIEDFSAWKANARGVDLNRQYPAGWDTIKSDPGKPAPSMYKGSEPLSEPETKALYEFTLNHDFKLAVSYHSSGEELYWQYKSKGELYLKSKRLADLISGKTGYQLVFPGPDPSGGGYTDWFIDEFKKPAFTPEIAPLVGPRPVPLQHYHKIWEENKEIGIMLAKEALID